jgi:hypothetical protein
MENCNKTDRIEGLLKTALQGIKNLEEEQEQTQLSNINERLNKIEVILEAIKKAIL